MISLRTTWLILVPLLLSCEGVTKIKQGVWGFGEVPVALSDRRRCVTDWDFNAKTILGRIGDDICIWNLSDGKLLSRSHRSTDLLHRGFLWELLSPDGKQAICSYYSGSLRDTPAAPPSPFSDVYNVEDGKMFCSLQGACRAAYSSDGRFIAVFLQQDLEPFHFQGQILDTRTCKVLGNFQLPNTAPDIGSLIFDPASGSILFTGCYPSRAIIFAVPAGKETASSSLPGRVIYSRFISGEREVFVSDGINIWSGKTTSPLKTFNFGGHDFAQDFVTGDGRHTLGIGKGVIQLYDIDNGQIISRTMPRPKTSYPDNEYYSILVSPDDRTCALCVESTVDQTASLYFFSVDNLRPLAHVNLKGGRAPIGFSRDGRQFLVGGPAFSLYDANTGRIMRTVKLEDLSVPPPPWCRLILGSNL